jgi:hypothetical protein
MNGAERGFRLMGQLGLKVEYEEKQNQQVHLFDSLPTTQLSINLTLFLRPGSSLLPSALLCSPEKNNEPTGPLQKCKLF